MFGQQRGFGTLQLGFFDADGASLAIEIGNLIAQQVALLAGAFDGQPGGVARVGGLPQCAGGALQRFVVDGQFGAGGS